MRGAYQWALVPTGQPIDIEATKVESGEAQSLAERVSRRLGNDGKLADQHAAAAIRHQLNASAAKLWEDGHVSVGELWRLYSQYPYMPRVRDRRVLEAGLTGPQLLWEEEGFALADGFDAESGRYRGLALPEEVASVAVTDATLIVQPERAKAQRAEEQPEGEKGSAGEPGPKPGVPTPTPKPAGKKRYFGSKQLDPERYASDFKKLADEVLAPLEATQGAEVTVTVEIEATAEDGFDDSRVRTVSENATTLKFEQSSFEGV